MHALCGQSTRQFWERLSLITVVKNDHIKHLNTLFNTTNPQSVMTKATRLQNCHDCSIYVPLFTHDCLLKTAVEGKTEGKRQEENQEKKMLDLFMEQQDNKISYKKPKKEQRAKSDGIIVSGTCLKEEHARRSLWMHSTCILHYNITAMNRPQVRINDDYNKKTWQNNI